MVHPRLHEPLNRPYGQWRPAESERGVDLVLAVAGDRDVHVSGKGDHVGAFPIAGEMHHHQDIASTLASVSLYPAVGSEKDVIYRLAVGLGRPWLLTFRGRRLRGQLLSASLKVLIHRPIDRHDVQGCGDERSRDHQGGNAKEEHQPRPPFAWGDRSAGPIV